MTTRTDRQAAGDGATTPATATLSPRTDPIRSATHLRTFGAMLLRDMRVLRRESVAFLLRTIGQPLMFVFVFTYVLPKIGSGESGMFGIGGGGAGSFATILVPGMVAMSMIFSGLMAVTMPLIMELSYTKEIEDRLLAPVPVWLLGIEKIVAGAVQGLAAAAVVFPIVLFVHAPGISPSINVNGWVMFFVVLIFGALLAGSLGLLIGTIIEPRKISMIFPIIMIPGMMLGCVFYPWAALGSIRWLQILALFNPIVYATEGLRTVLTPSLPHMDVWAFLLVLVGGTALFGGLAVRMFRRRVLA